MLEDRAEVKQPPGKEEDMLLVMMMAMSFQPAGVKPDCDGNTLEINACFAEKLDRAENRLQTYLQAAVDHNVNEDGKPSAVTLGIRSSQGAFEAYRDSECDAVYENWKEGTIRTVLTLDCRLILTNERTRTIWANWLHYADNTPPILPEPAPIE